MIWTKRPKKDPTQWHRWFAWHPVTISGTEMCAWMEWVERIRWEREYWWTTEIEYGWDYRLPEDPDKLELEPIKWTEADSRFMDLRKETDRAIVERFYPK